MVMATMVGVVVVVGDSWMGMENEFLGQIIEPPMLRLTQIHHQRIDFIQCAFEMEIDFFSLRGNIMSVVDRIEQLEFV